MARRHRQWGWVVVRFVGKPAADGKVLIQAHVRKWHPGFWLAWLKSLLNLLLSLRLQRGSR